MNMDATFRKDASKRSSHSVKRKERLCGCREGPDGREPEGGDSGEFPAARSNNGHKDILYDVKGRTKDIATSMKENLL